MDTIVQHMDNIDLMASKLPPFSLAVEEASYCHVGELSARAARLGVVCAGREICRADYCVDRSTYPCFGLEYVVRGQGRLFLGEREVRLHPGSLFMYGPGIAHCIRADRGEAVVKFFVDFQGKSRQANIVPNCIKAGESRRVLEPEVMTGLFEELIREGQKSESTREAVCAAYLELILLKSAEATAASGAHASQSLNTLIRCRSYIAEHAATLAGLQEMAKALHLDPHYICRLFKRHGLPTPHNYLTEWRMRRATALLVTSDHSIKAVAAQVGYADPLHFSRVFGRKLGCSPSRFREVNGRRG